MRIPALLSATRSHPIWGSLLGTGGVIFVWDRYNDYQSGSGLMKDLLGADWFQIVVHSPWFTLFGLALVLGSLWRLDVLSRRDEASAIEAREAKSAALQAARLAGVRQAVRLPMLIAKQMGWSRELRAFRLAIDKKRDQIEAQIGAYRDAWNREHVWTGEDNNLFPWFRHTGGLDVPRLYLETDVPWPDMSQTRPLAVSTRASMSIDRHVYDPTDPGNATFLKAMEQNIARAEAWIRDLDRVYKREQARLEAFEANLDAQVAKYDF